ncbi:hypothetical protein [Streptomyces griseochromogenes]|uniref:hypothetical protein n=1 Tax=Streptomyces griseochromogenes TaxID=68214 RepID=UPI0037BBFEB0
MRRNISSGKRLAGRLAGVAVLAAVVAGVTPSTASASDTWCGNWLKDPAYAYGVKAVSGTRIYHGPGYAQVNQGYYGPHWYAWAYEANAGLGPALNWRYRDNNALYTCYPQTEGGYYTPGVPDYQAYKVQVELESYPGNIYGQAVYWGG